MGVKCLSVATTATGLVIATDKHFTPLMVAVVVVLR